MLRANHPDGSPAFVRRVLIVVFVVAGTALLLAGALLLFDVLLLVFAGVLVALLLDGLARSLAGRTPLSRGPALGIVGVVLLGVAAAVVATVGPSIAAQVSALGEALREGYTQVRAFVDQSERFGGIADALPPIEELGLEASRVMEYLPTVFSVALGALSTTFVILVAGIYFAADPTTYVNGLVALVPRNQRERAREVVHSVVRALKKWLLGQFVLMTLVGVTVTIGLWLLDVPLALTLGLVSFFLDFIPIIGPLVAAVPAILIAFLEGPEKALQVLLLFVVIQQIESYVIAPYVQKRVVSLPPVMLILSQVLLGSVSGLLGIALATPLVVAAIVLVQMLYVEDVLDTEVDVLGEEPDEDESKDGIADRLADDPQPIVTDETAR